MQHCAKGNSFAMFYGRKSTLKLCISLIGICLFQPVSAEWKGGIEGGTDANSGSRIRLVLQNGERPFSQYLYADWVRTGVDGNSFGIGYNPRYWFDDKSYVFGESVFRNDEVFDIDREIRLLAGVGRQFIATEDESLFAEVGLGGRSIEYISDNLAATEDTSTEGLGLARLGYVRTVADTIKLDLNIHGSRSSEAVSEAGAEVGVSMRITQGSVRLAYRSRYQKLDGVSDAVTEDDTFISFGYSF